MKRKAFIALLMMFTIMMFFVGCEDDEFTPYIHKTYTDNQRVITNNIFNIYDVKSELTDIVSDYAENMPLTYAKYKMYIENKGTATFEFYKPDDSGKNRATLVSVEINLSTMAVAKIDYYYGHGKRVSGYEHEIVDKASENILSVFNTQNEIIQTSNYESIPFVVISVSNSKITSIILTE